MADYIQIILAYARTDGTLAHGIKAALEGAADARHPPVPVDVRLWEHDTTPTVSILESVSNSLDSADFGIFVFTPADALVRDGATVDVARDNVVFELALFIGMKSKERAFIIAAGDVEVPSDLSGITHEGFSLRRNARAADQNAVASDAQTAAGNIIDHIRNTLAADAASTVAMHSPNLPPRRRAEDQVIADLQARARIGGLPILTDSELQGGLTVVHAVHGVGRIRGFDPSGQAARFVWVDFEEPLGVALLPMGELGKTG